MNERRILLRVGLSLCLSCVFLLPAPVQAASFTVLNTNDGGAGSLRAAIVAANGAAGPHTIGFDIPGAGPHTIGLQSALPALIQTMTIDGYSQPGSFANTLPFNLGLNTVLRIRLDGSAAGAGADGLTLAAPDIAIRGLAISGFAGQIRVQQPRALITGNYIGTDIAGTTAAGGSAFGVAIEGGDGSVIGGTAEADRNLISGHAVGIAIEGHAAAVRYNLVGTDVAGTAALPNGDGIRCRPDEELVEIDRNLVSGNTGTGILAETTGAAGFCRLTRNYIGTNADTSQKLGNERGVVVGAGLHEIGGPLGNIIGGNTEEGVLVSDASGARFINNGIGTQTNVGSPDLGNGGAGIRVQSSSNVQIGDTFLEGNSFRYNGGPAIAIASDSSGIRVGYSNIWENGGLAIDLGEDGVSPNDPGDGDGGANQGQNFPEITGIDIVGNQTTVSMELDGAVPGTYRIQLYSNLVCDPTFFGEGQFHRETVDVVADANGDASFQIVLNADFTGEPLSATATDPNGNTSEFSRCVAATGVPTAEVPSLSTLGICLLAGILALAGARRIAG